MVLQAPISTLSNVIFFNIKKFIPPKITYKVSIFVFMDYLRKTIESTMEFFGNEVVECNGVKSIIRAIPFIFDNL